MSKNSPFMTDNSPKATEGKQVLIGQSVDKQFINLTPIAT